MSFITSFREARERAAIELGRQRSMDRPRPAPLPPQNNLPDKEKRSDIKELPPLQFGYYLDREKGTLGKALYYYGERHILLFGLNGSGKSTRIFISLLMNLRGRSAWIFDMKGELAFQTARELARRSKVYIINPYRLHGMRSDGFNPLARILARLGPKHPLLLGACRALGVALIDIEEGSGQYWTESAQGFLTALILWEIISAAAEKRKPSLIRVRYLMTEPDRLNEDGELISGVTFTAQQMIASGDKQIVSLVGRFVRENGRDEIASIQSTADTQTQWMLLDHMSADLERDGCNMDELRQKPTTVFVVLPADQVSDLRRWTRVVLTAGLRAHFEPGPMNTLFIMDEYRASIGKLPIVNDMWSVVRGYGVQFMPVVQSALQIEKLLEKEWEVMPAQAGLTMTLGPVNDRLSADWLSARSGRTTVTSATFNLGLSSGTGDGLSHGRGSGQHSINTNAGMNGGLSYQAVERPFLMAQDLMDLPAGEGRMWVPGLGSTSIPFFAPNYWKIAADWVRRVAPNPYEEAKKGRPHG